MAVHACNQRPLEVNQATKTTLNEPVVSMGREARDPKGDPTKTEIPKLKHLCHRPPKDRPTMDEA